MPLCSISAGPQKQFNSHAGSRPTAFTGRFQFGFPRTSIPLVKRLRHVKVAETSRPAETIEDIVLSEKSPEAAPVINLAKQEPISWTKQWYPVAVAELIDVSRPNAIKLLGRNLVIWLDAAGQWRCFEDRCPHRAAPLSEGKIWPDQGTLMCSYHGWTFNGDGDCVRIPQSANRDQEKRACSSNRACATSFPIQEHSGLLFVWGEAGKKAEEESAASPLPVDPMMEKAKGTIVLLLKLKIKNNL